MEKGYLIEHLKNQGFSDKIIRAFEAVKRENFVSAGHVPYAYFDEPLPIGRCSTISQPSTIAFMLELLELENALKILEIGSGCGYVLALMSVITGASEIFGVEIDGDVCMPAIERMAEHNNIHIFCKDGKKGLPGHAPFDRILISAACAESPRHLLDQLTENGIIVASVLDSIIKIVKHDSEFREEEYPGFRFVPLI